MLLLEQNTATAKEISTRVAVVVNGRVVLAGSAEELSDRAGLVASYLGEQPAVAQSDGGS